MKTITQTPQTVVDDPETLYKRGLLSQRKGQFQEAEKYFNAVLQIQPLAKVWFSLGNLHFSAGELVAAEEAYRQAIALRPNLVAIHNNLGYTLQLQGLFDEAITCYQKALEIQPNCIEASVSLGSIFHAQGKLSQAKQDYYYTLNQQLGNAKLEARDVTAAVSYFRQAIVLRPDSVEARYNLGIALSRQEYFEEAITCLLKVLELKPNYGEAYLSLGKIYQKQKQLQKAVVAYRQGLSLINPNYAKAVEAYIQPDTTQAPVTPAIPQSKVLVGNFSFPCIPTVSDENQRPFWSVIIPVYERTDYILDCLAGVLAQWPGKETMEILVLDNASTPPLFDLVNSIGQGIIRYYRHPENLGVVGNTNAGIALSRGKWIHILHDDDCVYPGFYSQLQQSLENCTQSVGAAFTGFQYINEKEEKLETGDIVSVYGDNRGIASSWLQRIGVCGLIAVPAVVVKRTTHERLGVYCPEILGIDEWEMYKRIAVFYDCWYEPGILAGYRVHSLRETSNNWLSGKLPKAVRRAIEITSSYLPIKYRDSITSQSLRHNFNYCLEHAIIPLNAGNINATFCIIKQALELDYSSEAIAKLFDWLNQDEAACLREEIATKLILNFE
jgi:tetratricopeptide (TPR) repeat protein/glycosyltransferase involved in cell wall biosynthesis